MGEKNTIILDKTSLGGEDFAFYLEKIPGAYFRIGCFDGTSNDLHCNYFDIDENCTDAHYYLGKLLSGGVKNDKDGTLVKRPEYESAIYLFKNAIIVMVLELYLTQIPFVIRCLK